MRIISKQRDYYDAAQNMGTDDRLTFLRKQKDLEKFELPKDLQDLYDNMPKYTAAVASKKYNFRRYPRSRYSIERFLVGFCGEVYPIIQLATTPNLREYTAWAYNAIDVINFLSKYKLDNELETFLTSKHSPQMWNGFDLSADYFNAHHNERKEHSELFSKFKAPCFVYGPVAGFCIGPRKHSLIVNPILRDYEFYRRFDVYSAYQELSMYVGGVLSNTEFIPNNTSDIDMRNSKGFDARSFKKAPTKQR